MDTKFDIVEQKHYEKTLGPFGMSEYTLYLKANVKSDEIGYVKVIKTDTPYKLTESLAQSENLKSKLEIQGFADGGEVLFKYSNSAQDIE